jgi:hypothetical protein
MFLSGGTAPRDPSGQMRLFSSPTPTPQQDAIRQALDSMPAIYGQVYEAIEAGATPEDVRARFNLAPKAVPNILKEVRARILAATRAADGTLKPAMRDGKFDGGRPDLAEGAQPDFVALDQLRNESGIPGTVSREQLLGICFLREAPERAIGSDRRAGKWGLRGKRVKRCFGVSGRCFGKKKAPSPRRERLTREISGGFHWRERSSPDRFAKISFGGGFSASLSGSSGGFENQDAAVVQMDFRCFPCLALVEAVGIGIGWIPGTVEPVEIGFVVGDPFLDRLPGWFDRLHGLDVEGRRWRARECDDSLPEAVEAEEEFNFLAADDFADRFHGALAARAFERIAAPCFEDEVAPEGAHVAGGLFRRCGDEEDLGGGD